MVFVFGSVYVVNYVYRLAYVEPALHPQDESHLTMVDRLIIAASTSDLVIGLFIVSASSWFRLGRTQESRNLSITSRFTSLCA